MKLMVWGVLLCLGLLLVSSPIVIGAPSTTSAVVNENRTPDLSLLETRIVQQTTEIYELRAAVNKYRDEVEKSNKSRGSFWNTYAVPILQLLAAVCTAVGGWLVTLLLLQKNFEKQDDIRREEQKNREDERKELYLINALSYFEGTTQKRSIGIAFIEAHWQDVPRLRDTWTAVLSNQGIYILSKILLGKEPIVPHEVDNLHRIHRLLTRKPLEKAQLDQIQDVLSLSPTRPSPLTNAEFRELERWRQYYPVDQNRNPATST